MAIRIGMSNLVRRVQDMINDAPLPGDLDGVVFKAQHVQDTLDRYVQRFRQASLDYELTYSSNVTITYQDYNAPFGYGDWEEDAVFQNASYQVITPDVADYISGHWHFSQSYAPPVYMQLGKTYDVFAASAVLLREWASKVALHFNASDSGVNMNREGKHRMLLELAHEFESKRRPVSARMHRTDLGQGTGQGQQQNWQWRVSAKTPR